MNILHRICILVLLCTLLLSAFARDGEDELNLESGWHKTKEGIVAKAEEFHTKALSMAKSKNNKGALLFFRSAVRLQPQNIRFLNDLGVTEMRTGEHQKAKWRFLNALKVDPDASVTKNNLEEIKKYMNDDEFMKGQGEYPQLHTLMEPPEVDATDFMNMKVEDDVTDGSILGDTPFVIRGAAQAWGWNIAAVNSESIAGNYGDRNADYYPHNMLEETVHPTFRSVSDAIERLTLPALDYDEIDSSNAGTYIQWNVDENAWRGILRDMNGSLPDVYDDLHWTEQCLSKNGQQKFNHNIHWKMMLIGEEGAGMFNHKDVMRMASWQVQLHGSKLWHVCSPDQDPYVYNAGDVDFFNPDYKNFPKARNATCYSTIVHPGDSLYYPRDWWHQTKNLATPTIAFSGSMINKHNVEEFAIEIYRQCNAEGAGYVFRAEEDFCIEMDKCADVWKGIYGKSILKGGWSDRVAANEKKKLREKEKKKREKEIKKRKKEEKKKRKEKKALKAAQAAGRGESAEGEKAVDDGKTAKKKGKKKSTGKKGKSVTKKKKSSKKKGSAEKKASTKKKSKKAANSKTVKKKSSGKGKKSTSVKGKKKKSRSKKKGKGKKKAVESGVDVNGDLNLSPADQKKWQEMQGDINGVDEEAEQEFLDKIEAKKKAKSKSKNGKKKSSKNGKKKSSKNGKKGSSGKKSKDKDEAVVSEEMDSEDTEL